jgi:RNA recognition motif-containing protein
VRNKLLQSPRVKACSAAWVELFVIRSVVNRQVSLLIGDLKPGSRERLRKLANHFSNLITHMKLYIGNLSFETTENDVEDLFGQHGAVTDTVVMQDKMTGRSRGFGFVTMSTATEGQAAIEALNGKQFAGRALTVNEARPREDRPARSFAGNNRR